MSQELINKAAQASLKSEIPEFHVGDTVKVWYRIVEGDKERLQPFIGTVIGRKGGGINETFRVRRIVNNQGVERVFPVHSPRLADVEIIRRGKIRRAKLYYLRKRVGKATRVRELKIGKTRRERELEAAQAQAAQRAQADADEQAAAQASPGDKAPQPETANAED